MDLLTILESYFEDRVIVHHNALLGYHTQWFAHLQSQDAELKTLLSPDVLYDHSNGQWSGVTRLHADNFGEIVKSFQMILQRKFSGKAGIDLFLCGHPLYWCLLYKGMGI
eukprot:2009316-Amphidinium_carterae.1